jgi:plasmid stabilization system protein ParE
MPTYNVDVLPIARADIADIYNYISLDNPNAALRVTEEIMDKIDTLAEFPERCPMVPDNVLARQGYRMLIIESYIAFFKVLKADVLVYRVLHGKRDYPQLLDQL